jgi:hypothetical protein
LGDVSSIIFFLIGAMTIVEVVDANQVWLLLLSHSSTINIARHDDCMLPRVRAYRTWLVQTVYSVTLTSLAWKLTSKPLICLFKQTAYPS